MWLFKLQPPFGFLVYTATHVIYVISVTLKNYIISDIVSTKYQVPSTKYQVPSTKYQVPSTKYQVPSTKY